MLGCHFPSARISPFRFINGLVPKHCKQLARYVAGMTKPPNILIVSKRNEPLCQWKQLLWTIVSRDSYVIYELERQDLGTELWKPYTSLLILDQVEELDCIQAESVKNYVCEGGRALFHCSVYPRREGSRFLWNCRPLGENAPVSCCFCTSQGSMNLHAMLNTPEDELQGHFTECICKTSVNETPVVVAEDHDRGKFIISQIDFIATSESFQATSRRSLQFQKFSSLLAIVMCQLALQLSKEDESPDVTPTVGVIFGDQKMASHFESFARQKQESNEKEYLSFIQWNDFMENFGPSNDAFVLAVPEHTISAGEKGINFDSILYWKHLQTQMLGRLLIYAEVITSTQEVLNRILSLLPQPHGFMIVAGRQTKGKGRSSNVWLSPKGCMMFSICICIPYSSVLGQKIPFIQHISAVAVVQSLRDEPGYEKINLRIKWPNDIYIGEDIKVGGLIVDSSLSNGTFHTVIGIGVNVSNEEPNMCLNRIIENYNSYNGKDLKQFKMEEFLAKVVTNLEVLTQRFEQEGFENFCDLYYKYWLHSNQKVRLYSEQDVVVVRGLDHSGFLLVKNSDGSCISLQPDGNSFDMMRGLISLKARQ